VSTISRRSLAAAGAGALACLAAGARPALAARPSFRVFMVLWRGESEVERSVRSYLRRASVPVEYTVRDAGQDRSRLPVILEEIRRARPDLVYVFSTEATLGIVGTYDADPAEFITDIPVVFAAVGDPVSARIVRDLVHSHRNVTGVIHLPPVRVQFEALTSFFSPRSIGVLYNRAETYGTAAVRQFVELAEQAGVDTWVETCTDPADRPSEDLIEPALRRLADQHVDALYLPSTSFFIPLATKITHAAFALGLPAFCANEQLIRGGEGLAGLIAPPSQVGEFAGYKIEQILIGGGNAGDMPIETLSRFVLLINMPVSLKLRVYPPITMLRYADIIQG
jgi:putative ABC transport system substrate-binding protein